MALRNLHTPHAPRGDQKAGLLFDGEIWHDEDVARFFGVDVRTLARRIKEPKAGEIDINRAEPTRFGGRRYWLRSKVVGLVGIRETGKEVRR